MRFFRPIMDFSEKYNILQSAMAASERIFKLLDTPPDVVSPAVTKSPEGPGRIEFDHVWFAYREVPAEVKDSEPGKDHVKGTAHVGTGRSLSRAGPREPVQAEQSSAGSPPGDGNAATPDWVLRDVTFAIEPGETAAIVGHTGAGK